MDQQSLMDRLVEQLAAALNSLGLNGTRLLWKWRRRRDARAEVAAQREVRLRAVTGAHKMCPHCRCLIDTGAVFCPDCGQETAHVQGPGAGRLLQTILPGVQPATAALLTANLAVYLLMGAAAGFSMPQGGGLGSLFSAGGFSREVLARFGWGYGPWVLHGEWWRLLTPMFLHAGLLHVLFNCLVLFQIGKLMEEEYGTSKIWVVYLVSGVCASLASNFVRPLLGFGNTPYVGASGAVFGLIGLTLFYGWRRGGPYGSLLRRSMIQWILYVTVFGLVVGSTDHFAHFGGLVGGSLAGLLVDPGAPRGAVARRLWVAAAWLGVLVCATAFLMAGVYGPDCLSRFR